MKITARPLKGETFELDTEPSATIEGLKHQIAATRTDMPVEQQKVVHQGRVLSNTATVQESGIKEGDVVVVMIAKTKPAAAEAAAPPAPAPADAPAPGAPAGAPVGSAMEGTIAMLCDMGFPRASVEKCLRAAFNNPDRAVEYLMSGIPEGVQRQMQAPPPQAAAQPAAPAPGAAAPAAAPPAAGPYARPLGAGLEGLGAADLSGPLAKLKANPRVLQQLRAVVQRSPEHLSHMLSRIHQVDPGLITLIAEHQEEFVELLQEPASGGAGGSPAGAPPQDPVAAMIAAAQLAQSNQAVGGGGASPPAAPAPGGAPGGPGAVPQAPVAAPGGGQGPNLRLSSAEEEAVQRLQGLGFNRMVALEAYLACDKNEEVAANYLFENMEG